ncbi:type VII secretion protein EccE [Mycobacterium kansasii]|uniref:type VII secretion protein EccE n=1 Tax=Mycobacterium kansasii TaxID=1768 RepID=UPI00055C4E64|nr:type VII secretion protein EccE [Mycobacterium kansasii]
MRQAPVSARIAPRAIVAAELVAAAVAFVLIVAVDSWPIAVGAGAAVGLVSCVLTWRGLTMWQWIVRGLRWARHRARQPRLLEPVDVTVGEQTVGVIVDGHTVCTMIGVLGKPYIPTLLYTEHTETPNTVPITEIAQQMQRYGLQVDVDIICEGSRTGRDNYAELYQTALRGLPAAGQRSVALLVRFDTRRDGRALPGLLWRRDTLAAAVAASQRIARALCQKNCRATLLTAAQINEAVTAGLGGPETVSASYQDRWTRLQRGGKAYVTSYFFSAEDVRAAELDNVWAYQSDHTTLVIALRSDAAGVRASALVRLTTVQPLASSPRLVLNPLAGRQWESLALTLPGRRRVSLSSAPVTDDLNKAVVAGASGVLLGQLRNAMVLMPVSDPAAPTRIALQVDDDKVVKQLIRRAAAAGERIAVYDPTGRWTMTAASPRIWTTRDMTARPPRPPTMVVHNGQISGYPAARTSVTVGDVPASAAPDIRIEQRGGRITVKTQRFRTTLTPVTFRNEETYLR